MRVGPILRALGLAAGLASAGPALAQDDRGLRSPILTIDSEQVFARSSLGRSIAGEVEARGAELAAENRRIEAQLIEEEKSLTEERATLPAEEFRAKADAFDEKVRRIRSEQDAKARALSQRSDAAQLDFLEAARPVLEQMMRDSGAAVILEKRSVFASVGAVDVTAEVIRRIDAAMDENGELSVTPDAAPEGQDAGEAAPRGSGETRP